LAKNNGIRVISDACHAIDAELDTKKIATFGDISCFSLHPLKNLNVWGDGGVITTNSEEMESKLRLLRNHGLVERDRCEIFAYNSRLDTIQAVVARHMLKKLDHITACRIANAKYYDNELSAISEVHIPQRKPNKKSVYHLYSMSCQNRDALKEYLNREGVDAKIHYPIPMHLQPAAKFLGHKSGSFPVAEATAETTISLPAHEFIQPEQREHVVRLIKKFYGK